MFNFIFRANRLNVLKTKRFWNCLYLWSLLLATSGVNGLKELPYTMRTVLYGQHLAEDNPMYFLENYICFIWLKFPWRVHAIIGSGNGLVLNRWQAITRITDDPVLWHICIRSKISSWSTPVYCQTSNTVETLYNTINFCWNTHKRHSIARPKGRGMGCLLWVQRATYCVDLSKLSSIKYLL